METAGFYKLIDEQLLHAPNAVYAPDYTLLKESRDDYEYPAHGWFWLENRQDALDFFGFDQDPDIDA